ncbi:DUF3152 domain-containing protein [Micromonospora sp. WMMD1120]|uniref:DUF3152 domain-containing protein n=1 Tax=Micromonospora sp. WMMD1120 TaxID=3016106 RepID=UPI002415F16F|nr:DUF3152 domain-containing protein [Micromonospora sp. WMMD1120]MDG4806331.1 DUF3152 domain-containing protein [Micromonospora sp. WMMD1120]
MPSPARRPGRRRRRLAVLAQLVAVVLAVGAAVTVIAEGPGGRPGPEHLAAEEIRTPPPLLAAPPTVDPVPADAVPSSPPPVLRVPGAVPSAGSGRFGYDARSGPVLGRAGELRRYRVAVESGSDESAADFGQVVEAALAGPGSWVDSGRLRLRQVPGDAPRDFTVYLATARTAGRMCAAGGVDIRVGGRPYTSCRAPGQVIINLDRWRLSVPHFVSAEVPLAVYRTYVVNHEVGHQLGHRHERCPGAGRPAPVMMQQTLFLKGCTVNPWPYLDGRRYSGPPL